MKKKAFAAMAANDAKRWAAAEMFYGDGAGIRRKLLAAELDARWKDPVYLELFNKAYEGLDKTKFAEMAIKERKAIDRATKASKNLRALKNGNLNGLSTGVFVVAGTVYLARQTGYDKIIWAETQKAYKKVSAEVKFRKARFQGRNVTKLY